MGLWDARSTTELSFIIGTYTNGPSLAIWYTSQLSIPVNLVNKAMAICFSVVDLTLGQFPDVNTPYARPNMCTLS